MIQKPFEQIERGDIDSLVTNQVKEGRSVEYKQALPTNSDKDKKEFLADVSSFANAAGGDLLYGVTEKRDSDGKTTGVPENAQGLAIANTDLEIRRLDSMIQAGIGPRIAGVRIRMVEGFTNGPVVLMRIPKSFSSPHMVTFQEHSRFYSRNNGGKYPLDVGEIRSAFALSESLPEKVRRFRDERLARVVAGETPLAVGPGPRTVLHLLPVAALDPTRRVDVSAFEYKNVWPRHGMSLNSRYNFDGVVFSWRPSHAEFYSTYIQVFRSGAIEAVAAQQMPAVGGREKVIPISDWERELIDKLIDGLNVQRDLGLAPPIFVMLSLLGVHGCYIPHRCFQDCKAPIDRQDLILPDVLVEDYSEDAWVVLRPAFDAAWQAAGWPRCMNYNAEGMWKDRSGNLL